MDKYVVGDLVGEFLAKCQVKTVFGMVSVHNIPMLNGIERQSDMQFVMVRGEMGGAHMADGYARVTGELGVILSSTGPGAANTVPGLVEASFAGSPVLHLTGQGPTDTIGRGQGHVHDVSDQLGMLKSVCKTAYQVRSAEEALGVLTRAALDAMTEPRGPVSVEIPIDIQRTEIERPATLDGFVLPLAPLRKPDATEVSTLVDMVSRAKRPMLWLGTGARGTEEAVRKLLDLGFGMVTSWAGRGVLPDDHPMNLGALNGSGSPELEAFYETVDLMIVVGSRVRGHETQGMSARLPENLVQIDVDPLANGRTYPNRYFVCADAVATLDDLVAQLPAQLAIEPDYPEQFRQMKAHAVEAFRKTLGPYAEFPAALREAMPRDTLWVRDITLSNSTWGNKLFPLYGPRDSVYPVGAGIGLGLSLAVGAAAGAGSRKTVAMVGDGGFFLNMGELWTAVQEQLDLVIIVMNDRGYGVIKHIQDALYDGKRVHADLQAPSLEGVAQLAGIPFGRVTDADGLANRVAEALKVKGPTLIEVDMTAIGEFPPYHPYGKTGPTAARAN